MPELLPDPGPLVLSQAPTPGISPSQVAQPYQELANTLDKGADASEKLAENLATEAGYKAVTTAPDGTLQIAKAPIIGPASEAYARAAKVAALADGEAQARASDIKLRTQFQTNPEGYLTAANAQNDKVEGDLTKQGFPDVGIALKRALGSTTDATYRSLVNRNQELSLKTSEASIDAGLSSARDDLTALARGGDTTSPAFQQAWNKVQVLTNEKVKNPLFAYPQEKAQFDLDQLHGEVSANVFLNHVDQVYYDQSAGDDGAPKGGFANALSAAQSILTDPSVKLSDTQRQQYFAKATSEVRANEAVRRQDVGEARAAETQLDQLGYLGARVDPEDVEGVAKAYRAAGDPAAAARLYAKFSRKPLNDDFGMQPLSDQTSQLRALQNGANPSTAGEANLIAHESGGDPKLVNRFGYAGFYQFGAPLLSDLGIYKPGANESMADWSKTPANAPGKWSGTFNVPGFPQVKSLSDFLGSPAAQKAAFDQHSANMDASIQAQGMDKYIGSSVGGVPITREGLHAMIHLGGVQGTLETLQSNGKTNPADANGTSLLDYARMGAMGAQGTPSANMWLAANRATVMQKEARADWQTVMGDYNKTGIRPADKVINDVVDAAHVAGDHMLLDQIGADTDRMSTARSFGQAPLPTQGSAIGQLEQAGAGGQLAPGQSATLQDLKRRNETIIKGLDNNPVSTAVQNFPERLSQPAPLNMEDPQAFAAGLAQRAKIAQFAAQNWQTGPLSALDKADVDQITGALAKNDPALKAQIYGGIATLPEDVRNATLKKLGGNDPTTLAETAAGSMMKSAPDIAQSIFRGQQAMQADKRYDPESEQSGKTAFPVDVAKVIPPSVFPLQVRTDPSGPYSTITAMVKARYADLSAQSGKTDYSPDRVSQAVNDVTGGVLSHNGGSFIAPARGMTQPQFDGLLQNITDRDLAGVSTLNGAPVTPDYLRRNAQLESVGDGRYWVKLGRDPTTPTYAYSAANTESPTKFVLDLRNRPQGNAVYQPPTVAVSP